MKKNKLLRYDYPNWVVYFYLIASILVFVSFCFLNLKCDKLEKDYMIVSNQLIEHQNCIEYLNAPQDIRHTIDLLTDYHFNSTCINGLWKK